MFQPNLVELFKLGQYTTEFLTPKNLSGEYPDSWIPTAKLSKNGLDFKLDRQLKLLRKWGKEYDVFFNEIRTDPLINIQFMGENYLHNNFYPTPDAEIYLSMILDYKPSKILEVGSGFSTLIARRAVDIGNLDTKIEIIDPSPRTSIESAAHKIQYKFIENISLEKIDLDSKSILFIDSSHISRSSGDLPYLYCKLIPTLPSGVIIHVHDTYLPYDYPTILQKRLYTENYLLHAILCHSSKFEILFSSHYVSRTHPDEMQNSISKIVASNNRFYGGSIWFKVL